MTEPQRFTRDELAQVLAAALLGLDDDDAPPTVAVLLNGRPREVAYVAYDPTTNQLLLDLGSPTGRPTYRTPWLEGIDPWRDPLNDARRRVTRPEPRRREPGDPWYRSG